MPLCYTTVVHLEYNSWMDIPGISTIIDSGKAIAKGLNALHNKELYEQFDKYREKAETLAEENGQLKNEVKKLQEALRFKTN